LLTSQSQTFPGDYVIKKIFTIHFLRKYEILLASRQKLNLLFPGVGGGEFRDN